MTLFENEDEDEDEDEDLNQRRRQLINQRPYYHIINYKLNKNKNIKI